MVGQDGGLIRKTLHKLVGQDGGLRWWASMVGYSHKKQGNGSYKYNLIELKKGLWLWLEPLLKCN